MFVYDAVSVCVHITTICRPPQTSSINTQCFRLTRFTVGSHSFIHVHFNPDITSSRPKVIVRDITSRSPTVNPTVSRSSYDSLKQLSSVVNILFESTKYLLVIDRYMGRCRLLRWLIQQYLQTGVHRQQAEMAEQKTIQCGSISQSIVLPHLFLI